MLSLTMENLAVIFGDLVCVGCLLGLLLVCVEFWWSGFLCGVWFVFLTTGSVH